MIKGNLIIISLSESFFSTFRNAYTHEYAQEVDIRLSLFLYSVLKHCCQNLIERGKDIKMMGILFKLALSWFEIL